MSQELDELVRDAYALPYGRARSALIEQVVARADAEGEDEAAFHHRLRLAYAYSQGGEPRLSFAPFARCVADFDADPQRYAAFSHGLLWGYKAIVHSMTLFPEVGRQQTAAMLDEMERRYAASGSTLHAVHQHRWIVAFHVGDRAATEEHFRAWSSAPRDALSDCAGCDPSEMVKHLTWVGRHAEAVALGLDTLGQTFACPEQPQSMQTDLLPALVAEGRLTEARDAHQRGYRTMRTLAAQLPGYAQHLRFCVATGNLERAREIFERHAHELPDAPEPFAAMDFQAVAARMLRELAETDPGAVVDDEHGVPSDASRLAVRYAQEARALAARFDARNETPHQGERIEHLLAEERWVAHLPLLALPTPPAREAAVDAGPAEVGVVPQPTVVEVPGPPVAGPEPLADPAEVEIDALLGLVEQGLRGSQPAVARVALERFAALRPETDRTEQERGRVAYARAELASEDGEHGSARSALRAALVHFDAAADEVRLQRTRATLGLLLAGDGDVAEASATADEALAWLVEHDEPARRPGWALQRATLDRAAGRWDEAYAGLLALFAEGAGTLERDEHVALLLAEQELARGRHEQAAGAASRALRSADPARWRWARRFRADARRALGDAAGAVEDRLEALAGTATIPDAAADPRLVLELAEDYLADGRASDGVEAGEVALRLAQQQPSDPRPLEHARLLLLRGYKVLDEPALALEQVRAVEDLLTDDTDPRFRAGLLEEKGELTARIGEYAAAVPALLAAAEAYALEGLAAAQVRALRWALDCATRDGALDQAADLVERAFTASDAIPEDDGDRWFHRGWLWLARAQDHVRGDRRDDALAAFGHAEATFRRGGLAPLATEAVLQRAEATGADLDELHALFIAAPGQTNAWYRSGWLLADRLREAGRTAEADALEARLDAAED